MRKSKRSTIDPSPPVLHPTATVTPIPDAEAIPEDAMPTIVTQAYAAASAGVRMRVLNRMLRAVGPLALAVVAGGAFARYVTQARWSALTVSLGDAARVTSSQVYELVAYVQQSNPDVVRQIASVLARDVSTMTTLGATVGAILIGYLSRHPRR